MNRIEAGTAVPFPRRRKFLRQFPGGFRDETYLDWERDYKVEAHRRWLESLGAAEFARLLAAGEHAEIARHAGAPLRGMGRGGRRPAADAYGFELPYRSRPDWETYGALLELAAIVRSDLRDLGPRDMIDVQSFLWVQGSDEYA